MHDRNAFASAARAALWATVALSTAAPALAQPARIALVVGNGEYSALPTLPACPASSRVLAGTLRSLGFQVVERENTTSGGLAAAIDELGRGMAAAPEASVFVYICGYGAGLNDRPFLLPISARIARPSDVMTQGLLAKAMLDALARGNPSRGVLALDLIPANGVSAPLLDSLDALPIPEGLGLIAATAPPPESGTTALSAALTAGLAAPEVNAADLLTGLKVSLGSSPGLSISLMRLPSVSRNLLADESPIETPAATTETATLSAAPAQSSPARTFPEEGAMSDDERRRVQAALGRLGYYSDRIDGRFGPETRAAIRRFQHELGAEMTGTLTGEQAARLVALD